MSEKLDYMPPKIIKEKHIPVEKLGKKLDKEPNLEFTAAIYKKFPEAEIYIVGGTVRDAMMGREDSKDYDLVIRNVPSKELGAFLAELGSVDLVGARFGVFKFVPEGSKLENAIDIALPRTETAFGTGGYRDFETQSDPHLPIKEDLSRRDFTWNALAWELRGKRLVDPFSGILDIAGKKVRAVGNPEERFREDYSRMLRAIRFAAKFGFEIEPKTRQAIKNLGPNINSGRKIAGKVERIVPYEVISREFIKALHTDPLRTLELLEKTELLYKLIPELEPMKGCEQPIEYHSEGDVWTHTKMALGRLGGQGFQKFFGDKKPSAELIFAVLLHDIGKPPTQKTPERDGADRIRFDGHDKVGAEMTETICKRLRVDSVPDKDLKVSTDAVVWLVRYHLFTLNTDLEKVRKTTLEKYFFNPNRPGKELLEVTFADASAALPLTGEPDFGNLKKLIKLLESLGKIRAEKPELPKPLLNGDEIMKILKLVPGPEVGKVILELREAQLTGKVTSEENAREFVKNFK